MHKFYTELCLQETDRALQFAQLRVTDTGSLINIIFDDGQLGNFAAINALKERDLTADDQSHLSRRLVPALSDAYRSKLDRRFRPRTDKLLLHLGLLLHESVARELAYEQASHRLATRRDTALELLRRLGSKSGDLALLRDLFQRFGDKPGLVLLAKFDGGFSGYTCCDLVANSSPVREQDLNYFEGLILERMARDGQLDYAHCVPIHPRPLLRALGRLRDPSFTWCVKEIIAAAHIELLPLAASVAGRISAEAVDAVRRRRDEFVRCEPGQP